MAEFGINDWNGRAETEQAARDAEREREKAQALIDDASLGQPMQYTLGLTVRCGTMTTFTPEQVFTSETITKLDAKFGEEDHALLDKIYCIINERNGDKPVWHDEMWRVRDGAHTGPEITDAT